MDYTRFFPNSKCSRVQSVSTYIKLTNKEHMGMSSGKKNKVCYEFNHKQLPSRLARTYNINYKMSYQKKGFISFEKKSLAIT